MEKGCVSCHAVQGLGGSGGPDLGRVQGAWSFLDIAGIMWNHSPKMEAEFERRKIVRPHLESVEMVDLIAFVYYLSYFDDLGDAARGELVFLRKHCSTCHMVGNHGATVGPSLDRFRSYRSPAFFTAALWNKGEKMTLALRDRGIPRPVFEGNDIVDILAYIRREAALETQESQVLLRPGNSASGVKLFNEKGCVKCHAVRGEGENVGPDLASREQHRSLTHVAGAMWDHGPGMWKAMKEAGIERAKLTAEEMSDIVTYLFFSGFVDPPGDPSKGGELFAEKGCLACHELDPNEDSVGPHVTEMHLQSASQVAASMWNHASKMEEAARAVNFGWPQFKAGEMRELVSFINSRSQANP